MAIDSLDVSELLLDDADTAPNAELGGQAAPTRRGRGRPKGSTTKPKTGGASRPATLAGTRELAQLLAKLIGGASLLVALAVQADEAAMTPQEANDIAKPAARLLAKSSVAARLVQLTGKGSDWIDLTLAVASYGLRLYPLILLRQQQLELQKQAQKGRPYGNGLTPEDAQLRATQPAPTAAHAGQPAAGSFAADAAAAIAADAARFGGLGFADPDALAAGAYGDVAANVRAAPPIG